MLSSILRFFLLHRKRRVVSIIAEIILRNTGKLTTPAQHDKHRLNWMKSCLYKHTNINVYYFQCIVEMSHCHMLSLLFINHRDIFGRYISPHTCEFNSILHKIQFSHHIVITCRKAQFFFLKRCAEKTHPPDIKITFICVDATTQITSKIQTVPSLNNTWHSECRTRFPAMPFRNCRDDNVNVCWRGE